MPRRWNLRPGTLLSLSLMLLVACLGNAGATLNGSEVQSPAPTDNKQALKGSVSVHLALSPYNPAGKGVGIGVGSWGLTDAMSFEKDIHTHQDVLEKAIAGSGLFSLAERNDPDFVLDVWVEEMESHLKVFSPFMTDMTSVWRVTRVLDGKVLFCDFVDGQGSSRGAGGAGQRHSIENAMQETIRNGLSALADDWGRHISAIQAGFRPSMGPVVPEPLQWIRQHWRGLRKGTSFDEVNRLLAPSMLPQEGAATHRIRRREVFETATYQPTPNAGHGKLTYGSSFAKSKGLPPILTNATSFEIKDVESETGRIVMIMKKDGNSVDFLDEEMTDFLTIKTRITAVESNPGPNGFFVSDSFLPDCFTRISPKGVCLATSKQVFTRWEDTQEYVTDIYQLTFLNGELTGGKLRQ